MYDILWLSFSPLLSMCIFPVCFFLLFLSWSVLPFPSSSSLSHSHTAHFGGKGKKHLFSVYSTVNVCVCLSCLVVMVKQNKEPQSMLPSDFVLLLWSLSLVTLRGFFFFFLEVLSSSKGEDERGVVTTSWSIPALFQCSLSLSPSLVFSGEAESSLSTFRAFFCKRMGP